MLLEATQEYGCKRAQLLNIAIQDWNVVCKWTEDTTMIGAKLCLAAFVCGCVYAIRFSLQWRHNGRNSVSNHQLHECLLNGLFGCRSKKTWKLRVTGLCAWNSPGNGEFPAQMASNAENVSIWWRHVEPLLSPDEYCQCVIMAFELVLWDPYL